MRTPGLAVTVILTLALGIGANAAIFTLVRGVLLKPLVNRDEDRLIYIRQSAPGIGDDNEVFGLYGGPGSGGATWRFSDDTGWQQVVPRAAILLGGEGSGSYAPDFFQPQVLHDANIRLSACGRQEIS